MQFLKGKSGRVLFIWAIAHPVTELWGYKEDDIVVLTDDAQNPRQIPSRDNIVSCLFVYLKHLILNMVIP